MSSDEAFCRAVLRIIEGVRPQLAVDAAIPKQTWLSVAAREDAIDTEARARPLASRFHVRNANTSLASGMSAWPEVQEAV